MNPFRTRNPLRLIRSTFIYCLVLTLVAGLVSSAAARPDPMLVYFGTYTGANSKGIYVSHFDSKAGTLSEPELAAETPQPSFLASPAHGRFLYAVNETTEFEGNAAGSVSAFSIERPSGKLTLLNRQSSLGAAPCHLTVDGTGENVLVANYGGGNLTVFPVQADGRLRASSCLIQHQGSSVNSERQTAPHAHGIYLEPSNRFAFATDLGLDKLMVYRFEPGTGTLTPHTPHFAAVAPGSGPRHFALHPGGRFAYVINEMLCTVTVFKTDLKRGRLENLQTLSTLPPGEPVRPGYSTAELFAHPSGKFLYGSNRGHDTIVVYQIDAKTGTLSLVEHASTQGKTPRSFGISPDGRWLFAANQNSNSVVLFEVNRKTGHLSPTGRSVKVGSPVSVLFVSGS